MPTTPADRLRNPLRQLRVTLGGFGAPESQEEFAKRIGISVATVRSIENERRPLRPSNCLDQIKAVLWAVWNSDKQEWYPIWDPSRPYTKEDAEKAARLAPQDPYIRNLMIHSLMERLLAMCEAVKPEHLPAFVIQLARVLAEQKEEYALTVDLEPTEPHWFISKDSDVFGKKFSGVMMLAKYRGHVYDQALPPRKDVGGIYDFRSHRSFDPAEYPVEKVPESEDDRNDERTYIAPKTRRTARRPAKAP